MNYKNGFATIPLILGLLLMAVAVPMVTQMAQKSQDNRNMAAPLSAPVAGTATPMSGTCSGSCVTYSSSCFNIGMGDGTGSCSNGGICCKGTSQGVTITKIPTYNPSAPVAKTCSELTCLSGQTKVEQGGGKCTCQYQPTAVPTVLRGPCSGAAYQCSGGVSSHCNFESGERQWIPADQEVCKYGCGANGMCNGVPTATPTIPGDCGQLNNRHLGCGCAIGFNCESGICGADNKCLPKPSITPMPTALYPTIAGKKCCCVGDAGDECAMNSACTGNTEVDVSVCYNLGTAPCQGSCVTYGSSCYNVGMGDGPGKCANGGICCRGTSQGITPTKIPTYSPSSPVGKDCSTLTCLSGQTKVTDFWGKCTCQYQPTSVPTAAYGCKDTGYHCKGGSSFFCHSEGSNTVDEFSEECKYGCGANGMCNGSPTATPTIPGDCGQINNRHAGCGCAIWFNCESGICGADNKCAPKKLNCCCDASAGAVGNATAGNCSWESSTCGAAGKNTSSDSKCGAVATPTLATGVCNGSCVTYAGSCYNVGMGGGSGSCSNGGICCKGTPSGVPTTIPTYNPSQPVPKTCTDLTCLSGQTKVEQGGGKCICQWPTSPTPTNTNTCSGQCINWASSCYNVGMGDGVGRCAGGSGICCSGTSQGVTPTPSTCNGQCVTWASSCFNIGMGEGAGRCPGGNGICCSGTSQNTTVPTKIPTSGPQSTPTSGTPTKKPTSPPSGCGSTPADICTPSKLSVRPQCYGTKWDYDEQLCGTAGRTDTCGGKPYCCPAAGGSWTTDMTVCNSINKCLQCPSDFKCYKNGSEFRWFVTGYVQGGFSPYIPETVTEPCGGVPKPAFLGKSKGDANCDGKNDTADYSLWHKEFYDGDAGAISSKKWNADFTGPNGVCDGIVDTADYSLWHKYFYELMGTN